MSTFRAASVQEKTFVDVVINRASDMPDRCAFRFVPESAREEIQFTYRYIFEQASGFAALLQQKDLTGARVLIVCQSNHYFVIALFACLLAGAVAVPVGLPKRHQRARFFTAMLANADARGCIVESDESMDIVRKHDTPIPACFDMRALQHSTALSKLASQWIKPTLAADSLALLHYTSGTADEPKGVMISHGNLMDNSAIIYAAFGHTKNSIGLMALPLFHDMGLFGGILQPMYGGFTAHLMKPAELVKHPQRWLQLISERRVTTSGGPNFMYELATRALHENDHEHKVDLAGLDLSCWNVAFCGGETVRANVLADFAARFAPVGFDAQALYACYGMAESTLFICGRFVGEGLHVDKNRARHSGQPIVSCGRPRGNTHLMIVDPRTCLPAAAGNEGEIWVSGDSNAMGYWQRPELSALTFAAKLQTGEGPFLRTGDLGYLRDGELYLTGRHRDLIELRGRAYLPQDLELETDRCQAAHHPRCSVAFSVKNGQTNEQLVIAIEVDPASLHDKVQLHALSTSVREAIDTHYQLPIDDLVFVPIGRLPKTSNGKLRRAQCRLDYLSGRFVNDRKNTEKITPTGMIKAIDVQWQASPMPDPALPCAADKCVR